MTDKRIDDSELHALVDNELDAARRAEIEAWLSENPEAAGRVARYRAQNAGMHALFDGVLTEELPPIVAGAVAGRRTWPRRLAAVAAGLVLLVAGGAAGWVLRGELASWMYTTSILPRSGFSSFCRQSGAIFQTTLRAPSLLAPP